MVHWKAKECCGVENDAHLPFWTICREINNRSFEDLEQSFEDILASFFHTLYLEIATFVSHLMISYDNFFVGFFLSSYVSPLVYSVYLRAPYNFNKISLLLIKK
jgi:hypothetical protein